MNFNSLYNLLEESNSNKIINSIKYLNDFSDKSLSGGNCGQSTYALYKFLSDNYDIHLNIGVISNNYIENENELIMGEPDIYHMFLVDENDMMYDETGIIDSDYLLDLAETQYGESSPSYFVFNMPEEEKKILQIIRTQTNYNIDWQYFHNILNNMNE